jgi:hypothetical protein
MVTVLACSGAPTVEVQDEGEAAPVEVVEPVGPDTRAEDPLLAHARGQMRRGRVPDDVREQLLASRDPDHRRAARLLQAIAGETPAAALPRVEGDAPKPIEPPTPPEPLQPIQLPAPEPPSPVVAIAEPVDDERLDPLPELETVPLDSPLRAWLEIRVPELEPDAIVSTELPLEWLRGPELLLLRERPPRPASNVGLGLVILTRASLRDEPDADRVWLELVGSRPVLGVWMQPLDEFRVRLTIPDAGAVPAFVQARPENQVVTILDVARRERDVEIELALTPGWRLAQIDRLDNGAAVGFAWSDTLPP